MFLSKTIVKLPPKSKHTWQTQKPLDRWQFECLGYFAADPDSTPEELIFNTG